MPAVHPRGKVVQLSIRRVIPGPVDFVTINSHHVDAQIEVSIFEVDVETVGKVGCRITDHCTVVLRDHAVAVHILKFQVAGCRTADFIRVVTLHVFFVLVYADNLITVEVCHRIPFHRTRDAFRSFKDGILGATSERKHLIVDCRQVT